jgi:hypothetical protein
MRNESEKLQRGKFYRGVDHNPDFPGLSHRLSGESIAYRWTGERRPPRKGEWYLSGAVIEAYQASNDLDSPYHIAEPVLVRIETKTVITEIRK